MNRQQIFDKVSSHLLRQNALSIRAGSLTCQYRGDGGLMCAIGCLIKDEFYDKRLESLPVHYETVIEALRLSGVEVNVPEDCSFLTKLQKIHDEWPPATWDFQLKDFATEEGLDFTPPETVA